MITKPKNWKLNKIVKITGIPDIIKSKLHVDVSFRFVSLSLFLFFFRFFVLGRFVIFGKEVTSMFAPPKLNTCGLMMVVSEHQCVSLNATASTGQSVGSPAKKPKKSAVNTRLSCL